MDSDCSPAIREATEFQCIKIGVILPAENERRFIQKTSATMHVANGAHSVVTKGRLSKVITGFRRALRRCKESGDTTEAREKCGGLHGL